ncbi:Putative multidrug export ATP-binding/permease protein [Anaerohalosphaera lusitana]|uniref:Putative multidrug export ATP-binding/permease protein n=1 Tax=Anaerohalosphaera lusitana TaxID=1936003 RepID=A0A1U9NPR6_9BACT|nr:ABC transporter ATP-binding protein [Anaerohalosphaera lusitana]AQT69708.1 Putative multidrug export ATP-binding/permease protein [Anaerohalosphaera lusitana]
MIKRFAKYYKPHLPLFIFTMTAAVASAVVTVFIPAMTRKILETDIPKGDTGLLLTSMAIMLGLIIAAAVFAYIRVKWGHILGVRMEFDMREKLFTHLQKLSFNYFDNTKTGHIMSRISNDLNMIAEIAHHAPEDILISLALIIGAFIAMFSFNAQLAWIAMIPMPFLIAWGILYGGKMRKGFRQVRKKIADINSSVENSVQGIREVKSFANEEEEICKFDVVNCSFRQAKEDIYGTMARFFCGMNFLIEGYFFVVIAGGAWLIYTGSSITHADLLAFVLYIYFILNPIRRLVNFSEQLQRGVACFERYTEIMDVEPDIVDNKDAHDFSPVTGHIEFSDVSFKYNGSDDWILKNVDLDIKPGSTVAIVGESGAGKSTIVSLIPRFYEATKGRITIDGHSVSDLKQKFLRENIGIVQQNVFLFDTTIRENIMYGRPDATEEDLIDAAKKANILDYIRSLPDGFETLCGERGVKLSGGQKQRISIARTFLKNPPIFIFDEATSSLDTESEALVQKSLDLLRKDRTTIVIAHRLSTVRNANYIYVVREGEIVEHGTHNELLDNRKYYHTLYTMNVF